MEYDPKQVLLIYLVSPSGNSCQRRIVPIDIRFGVSPRHEEKQWLMDAYDVDERANRTYAMAEMTMYGRPASMDVVPAPVRQRGEL